MERGWRVWRGRRPAWRGERGGVVAEGRTATGDRLGSLADDQARRPFMRDALEDVVAEHAHVEAVPRRTRPAGTVGWSTRRRRALGLGSLSSHAEARRTSERTTSRAQLTCPENDARPARPLYVQASKWASRRWRPAVGLAAEARMCGVLVMEVQVTHEQELARPFADIFITGGITFHRRRVCLHMFSTGLCTRCKLRDAYSTSPLRLTV